jgi:hypothetical protein
MSENRKLNASALSKTHDPGKNDAKPRERCEPLDLVRSPAVLGSKFRLLDHRPNTHAQKLFLRKDFVTHALFAIVPVDEGVII